MNNKGTLIEISILQIIALLFVGIAIIYFIKQYRLSKYEKRIESFSLFTDNDKQIPFFDKIYFTIVKFVNLVARFLEKQNVLPKYANSFEKYITLDEQNTKNGYTYLAVKFLITLLVGLLFFLNMNFQYFKFNLPMFIISLILAFFVPDIFWVINFKRKTKLVEDDLLNAIIIMNNAFKSGNNITQAVEIVKNELEGPISDEFKKIYIDINYGLSLDVVFNRFYERVRIEDAKYITSSLTLLNKTGGNIVNVFSLIEKTFFDKKKLNNELKSLTASSILVCRLLSVMPFVIVIVLSILNIKFFAPFFTSIPGLICFIVLIIMYVLYLVIINRMVKVKL